MGAIRLVWAWALVLGGIGCGGPAFTTAGAGGSEFAAPPPMPLDVSSCFPAYPAATVRLTVPTGAAPTTASAVAYGPTSKVCSSCLAAFGYRTYDGLPPAATCAHADGSDDYCCEEPICVPDGTGGAGNACMGNAAAPYVWTCPVGAAPALEGCMFDGSGLFCCPHH